jgi:energy-coupling factor transporter ATP-binding protein EcfA2
MDIENAGPFTLTGLDKVNVILGKNGCGKSFLLKVVEQSLHGRAGFGKIQYLSPERGGLLQYEPNIEQAMNSNSQWIRDNRRANQSANFKQQSTTLFRQLEIISLREIEREHTTPEYVPRTFDTTVDLINGLLDRVRIERDINRVFRIVDRETGAESSPLDISSGESELISLGVEVLAFSKDCDKDLNNFMLIDEPDVHLHPDLQDRLARFIVSAITDRPLSVILATHSTALLAGLSDGGNVRLAFKRRGATNLEFSPVNDVDKAILPIFGAHPLSNVFNQAPALLVEGEDDERVWQQAVRTSQGRIRLYPCAVDSVDRLAEYETEVNNIIDAVYDNAQAFSLRDRDLHPEMINDVGHVARMRLSCRAAENLMLSDDVLASAQKDWPTLQESVIAWVAANTNHQYHSDVQAFIAGGFDRKGHDLKTIRNILVGLISNKPWEVLVGQRIAALSINPIAPTEGSLADYLGEKVCTEILKYPASQM